MMALLFIFIWMALQIWWALVVHLTANKPSRTNATISWTTAVMLLLLGSWFHPLLMFILFRLWWTIDMDVYLQTDPPSDRTVTDIKIKNIICVTGILVINLCVLLFKLSTCVKING